MKKISSFGFTLVEVMTVVVIIGLLVTLSVIGYRNVQERALKSGLISDLSGANKQLAAFESDNLRYPADLTEAVNGAGLKGSAGVTFQYTLTGAVYCLTAKKSKTTVYMQSDNPEPKSGVCTGHTP